MSQNESGSSSSYFILHCWTLPTTRYITRIEHIRIEDSLKKESVVNVSVYKRFEKEYLLHGMDKDTLVVGYVFLQTRRVVWNR